MTLADLRPGDRARITGYRATSGEPPRVRLMEMGLLPGTDIEVLRFAPLGDPISLRIRRFQLSVRREDAAVIEVDANPERQVNAA